jgi:thiol-disulfide isomerase/thioredoxin
MPGIATVLYNDFIRPRKRMILYVFLVVVFSAASYFAYVNLVKPRMAFYENFGADVSNDNNRQDQAVIMGFFADWCPYCKKAMPDWTTFIGPSKDPVPYGKYLLTAESVDCTDGNDPRIQKYSINGYPTVIIIKGGEVVRYEGKITADNLTQFVTSTLGSPAQQ